MNGPDYHGMEDNDLRGYLDGAMAHPWNQVSQVHVRVGRKGTHQKRGDFELFRVLQRWEGIVLPAGAEVEEARLTLSVESAPPRALRLFLYQVRKDWNPGRGGIQQDNVSPPAEGEVSWNEAAHLREPWGLPGAGFASDSSPLADTAAMPLAEAVRAPGESSFEFVSHTLTSYVAQRSAQGQPLLFLLKLADDLEDEPGTVTALYSGNHGDSRQVHRRPHLVIHWRGASEQSGIERRVLLEHGRTYELPRIVTGSSRFVALTFDAESGSGPLTAEIRGGRGDRPGPWQRAALPIAHEWDWIEVRLVAAEDPIRLGESFRAELADTWVRGSAPEQLEIPWSFVSPSGVVHRLRATYLGRYRWSVEFQPNELGRWRYLWGAQFASDSHQSSSGTFHVLPGTLAGVLELVQALEAEAREIDPTDRERASDLERRLSRLVRAGILVLGPEAYRGGQAQELRSSFERVRETLAPKAIPSAVANDDPQRSKSGS